MTLPTNCGPCDCNCIVADTDGRPYLVGLDRDGNQAIIIPRQQPASAWVEFVHGAATCQMSAYPLIAIEDGVVLTAAIGVLSAADTAPVIIALRKNGVQVSSLTIPAGDTHTFWAASAFPLVLDRGDRVETVILSAGANDPTVSVQAHLSIPGIEAGAGGSVAAVECVEFTGHGTLAPGEGPGDIAVSASAPGLCFYQGAGGNHDSLYLVAKTASSGALGHRRVWPPDPTQAPLGLVAWTSSNVGETPATPADPSRVALAVDTATTTITHRWDVGTQIWAAFPNIVPQRVEFGQAGAHRPPAGPVALTWFPHAGTLRVDIAGVWTQHSGAALTVEAVNQAGDTLATFTIPDGDRTASPSLVIVIPAGSAVGMRIASTPTTPGEGLSVVTTFTRTV